MKSSTIIRSGIAIFWLIVVLVAILVMSPDKEVSQQPSSLDPKVSAEYEAARRAQEIKRKIPSLKYEEDDVSFNQAPKDLLAKLIYVQNNKIIVSENASTSTFKEYPFDDESIYNFSYSPQRNYISYQHWSRKRDGCSGPWCWPSSMRMGIIKLDAEPKLIFDTDEPKVYYDDLAWSPDEKYISYTKRYDLEVMEVATSKVVFTIAHEKYSKFTPASWVTPTKISYIDPSSKLYLIDIITRETRIIDTNVNGYITPFESPTYPLIPRWSRDGRYVMYYTKDNIILLDTYIGKKDKIGIGKEVDVEGWPTIDYEPWPFHRWTQENILYVGNSAIDPKSLATTSIRNLELDLIGEDFRLIWNSPAINTYKNKIIDKNGNQVCENLAIRGKGIIDPRYALVTRTNEYIPQKTDGSMYLVDLSTCSYVSQQNIEALLGYNARILFLDK